MSRTPDNEVSGFRATSGDYDGGMAEVMETAGNAR